jgi:hypothetical protein
VRTREEDEEGIYMYRVFLKVQYMKSEEGVKERKARKRRKREKERGGGAEFKGFEKKGANSKLGSHRKCMIGNRTNKQRIS